MQEIKKHTADLVHLFLQACEICRAAANAGMQDAIKGRVKGYPKKALAEMHKARCLLPAKVARLLKQQPQLVSPAVQTFYYRDVGDMKAAARLRNFPSEVSVISGGFRSEKA